MAGPKCGTCDLPKIGMIRIPDDESDYMCGDCIRVVIKSNVELIKAEQDKLARAKEVLKEISEMADTLGNDRDRCGEYWRGYFRALHEVMNQFVDRDLFLWHSKYDTKEG